MNIIQPSEKYTLYNQHLKEIADVKFTVRECDIIICVIHSRSDKKIAQLLNLSYRTVNTHLRNIMLKFGYNNREQIIDLIEKLNKREVCERYYRIIINGYNFTAVLLKITNLHNQQTKCQVNITQLAPHDAHLYKLFKKDLQLAGITIQEQNLESTEQYKSEFICMMSQDNSFVRVIYDSSNISTQKATKKLDLAVDYYSSIFEIVYRLTNNDKIAIIANEFRLNSISTKASNIIIPKHNTNKNNKFLYAKYLLCLLLISTLSFTCYSYYLGHEFNPVIIRHALQELSANFSNDNISNLQKTGKNYLLLRDVEDLVDKIISPEGIKYFSSDKISSEELINCLYVLHALASQYHYHFHQSSKSRHLLDIAKKLVENYICNNNKNEISLSQLNAEELYNELKLVNHLPEIYTKILYDIGRSYIYKGDFIGGKEYFLLSEELGKKLNLFEGFLSSRSGLALIRQRQIEEYLSEGKNVSAKHELKKHIASLELLKNDMTAYKTSYSPADTTNIVVPAQDEFNILYCIEQIVKSYSKLILVAQNEQETQNYAESIIENIKFNQGDLKELLDKTTSRRAARIYNCLGYILLQFYDLGIKTEKITSYLIEQKIVSQEDTTLKLIEHLFQCSVNNSRNNEHEKADGYNGLIEVHKRLILSGLTDNDISQNYIQEWIEQRDKINKYLNRQNKHFAY